MVYAWVCFVLKILNCNPKKRKKNGIKEEEACYVNHINMVHICGIHMWNTYVCTYILTYMPICMFILNAYQMQTDMLFWTEYLENQFVRYRFVNRISCGLLFFFSCVCETLYVWRKNHKLSATKENRY